mmetsp:Transcript_39143/g.85383  ORF Transcript_39143/g.85383 Transcript_39143/m.85383 type:complete len:439 (-) Transcript_39143:62-1378(-)
MRVSFFLLLPWLAPGYGDGSPSCFTPVHQDSVHAADASHGDGGYAVSWTSGLLSISPRQASQPRPFRGFLVSLPTGVEPCSIPHGTKRVDGEDCVSGMVALTHTNDHPRTAWEVQVTCRSASACGDTALAILMVDAYGDWYNVSAVRTGVPGPCDAVPVSLTKESIKALARDLRGGDNRLVRTEVDEALVETKFSNVVELLQALSMDGLQKPALTALVSGITSRTAPVIAAHTAYDLIIRMVDQLPTQAAGSDAAEILYRLAREGAATESAMDALTKAFLNRKARPSLRMFAAAGLGAAASVPHVGNKLVAAEGLVEELIQVVNSGVVTCPRPSCNPPSYISRAAMFPDDWLDRAEKQHGKMKWVMPWGALEALRSFMSHPKIAERLSGTEVIRSDLCFLQISPDMLESTAAEAIVKKLGIDCKAALKSNRTTPHSEL